MVAANGAAQIIYTSQTGGRPTVRLRLGNRLMPDHGQGALYLLLKYCGDDFL